MDIEQHNLRLPDLASPAVVVGLGPLALGYILQAGGSGYVVYPEGADRSLLGPALRGLRHVAATEGEDGDD